MDRRWSVQIVIPVFNGWDKTRICLDAIRSSGTPDLKTIVVDHGSTDETAEKLAELYPHVRRIAGTSDLWWTGATNLGIRAAMEDGATHVILLNNDSYVGQHTISVLLRQARVSPGAVIAATQRNVEDESSFVPVATTCFLLGFSTLLVPSFFRKRGNQEGIVRAPLIMGARGVLIPRKVIDDVGLLDETRLPHYGADHDFYLRCRSRGVPLLVAMEAIVRIDNSKTTLAKDYGSMSIDDFIATLRHRRSHRNIRDLASLFRLHYPIRRLYWIGVTLNIVRHIAKFALARPRYLIRIAAPGGRRST